MSLIEWVIERAVGPEPEPYDWRTDPRIMQRQHAPRTVARRLDFHEDECMIFRIEINQKLSDAEIARHRDRKTLIMILVLVAATSGAAALQYIANLLPH
mgnify:CR=1 FL=1